MEHNHLQKLAERKKDQEALIALRKLVRSFQYLFISIVIAALGVLTLIFATYSRWPELLKEIGIALTTAGVVGIAIDFLTRKQFIAIIIESFTNAYNKSDICAKLDDLFLLVDTANNFRNLGIKELYQQRNDNRAYEIISTATAGTKIRLLGTCLQSFQGIPVQNIFREKLKQGCTIELLVLDSESSFVAQRGKEEIRDTPEIKESIYLVNREHSNFITKLHKEGLKNISINYYNAPPNVFLIITSTTLLIGFYLRDQQGQDFPQIELEIRPEGISDPFIAHFDSLMAETKAKKIDTPVNANMQ